MTKSNKPKIGQKITPNLWFDNQAEEAVNFYVSVFENSKIVNVARYGEEWAKVSGRPKGTVMTVAFELDGPERVMNALLQMKKIDIKSLEQAYRQQ